MPRGWRFHLQMAKQKATHFRMPMGMRSHLLTEMRSRLLMGMQRAKRREN